MKFSERVKNMIRSWLNIQPSPMNTVSLYEAMPFELRTIEAMLWYRGDAAELDQFYKQAGNDNVMRAGFGRIIQAPPREKYIRAFLQ